MDGVALQDVLENLVVEAKIWLEHVHHPLDLLIHLQIILLLGIVIAVIVVIGVLEKLVVIIVISYGTDLVALGQVTSLAYEMKEKNSNCDDK